MLNHLLQSKRKRQSNVSRLGVVMIDMLVGLVVLAAFLIFGTMVILQIEETKLDSLERNDEMAWATMQQSAALQGLQANTGSGLFNEGSYGVASTEGAAIRVNSNTSLGTPLEVGNLVITPRILTISDVPGRKGKVAVGYILQDCSNAGQGDEIMPREAPPPPEYSVTLLGSDDSSEIATFVDASNVYQSVSLSSDQISWSDDGSLVLHYRVEGGGASLNQVNGTVHDAVDGVPLSIEVNESLDSLIANSNLVTVPFEADFGSGTIITWSITFVPLDIEIEHTRSGTDTDDVTLTDVTPELGISGAVGVNQLVTIVTDSDGGFLPTSLMESALIRDELNGELMSKESVDDATGRIYYDAQASLFDSYADNDWDTIVDSNSIYIDEISEPDHLTNLVADPSSISISFDPAGGNYEDGVNVTLGATYTNAFSTSQLVDGVSDSQYYTLRYEVFEDSVAADEGDVTAASSAYAGSFYIQLDPGAEGYVEAKTFNTSDDIQYFLDVTDGAQNYYSEYGPIGLQWGKNDGAPWEDTDSWYPEPESDDVLDGEGEIYLMGKLATGDVEAKLNWWYHDPDNGNDYSNDWVAHRRPHILGGLIFNNEDYTYTVMGPSEDNWIPMYFDSGDGSRSLVSVLNSPHHDGDMSIYDPHVLNVDLELYNDLEINVSNTSAFKLDVDTINDAEGDNEVIKTGPGTMYILVAGDNDADVPVRVKEGQIVCAVEESNQTSLPYTPIILDGGALNINRRNETSQSGVDVESSSILNMGDGTTLYDGENTEFTYRTAWLNVDDGASLTIKNWDPGDYILDSDSLYPYETDGGNTKIFFNNWGDTELPSDESLSRIYFEGWTDYDPDYTGGARLVAKDGYSWRGYYLVPPKKRQSTGIGYLNVTETSTIYFSGSSKLDVEGISISDGAYLNIRNWSGGDVFHSEEDLDWSVLNRIRIYSGNSNRYRTARQDSNGNIQRN